MIQRAERLPIGDGIYLKIRVRDYQVAKKIAIPGS